METVNYNLHRVLVLTELTEGARRGATISDLPLIPSRGKSGRVTTRSSASASTVGTSRARLVGYRIKGWVPPVGHLLFCLLFAKYFRTFNLYRLQKFKIRFTDLKRFSSFNKVSSFKYNSSFKKYLNLQVDVEFMARDAVSLCFLGVINRLRNLVHTLVFKELTDWN